MLSLVRARMKVRLGGAYFAATEVAASEAAADTKSATSFGHESMAT